MQDHREFSQGDEVIYGVHGRCNVAAIETRNVGGNPIRFYKLEVKHPPLSRTKKKEPAIWLPVDGAWNRGLRTPIDLSIAERILETLGDRDPFFDTEESWRDLSAKLEATINAQGAIGLSKVVGFMAVYEQRLVVFPPEVRRFALAAKKQLIRELSEVWESTLKDAEERIDKATQAKLAVEQ